VVLKLIINASQKKLKWFLLSQKLESEFASWWLVVGKKDFKDNANHIKNLNIHIHLPGWRQRNKNQLHIKRRLMRLLSIINFRWAPARVIMPIYLLLQKGWLNHIRVHSLPYVCARNKEHGTDAQWVTAARVPAAVWCLLQPNTRNLSIWFLDITATSISTSTSTLTSSSSSSPEPGQTFGSFATFPLKAQALSSQSNSMPKETQRDDTKWYASQLTRSFNIRSAD